MLTLPDSVDPSTRVCRLIDVYHGDSVVSYHNAFTSGIVGAYIKSSQGSIGEDPAAHDHYTRAKLVGMLAGNYHFFTPFDDPIDQATHFLNVAHHSSGDLLMCLDVETPGPNIGARAYEAAAFIKSSTGRWPAIYSGDSFFQAHLIEHFNPNAFHLWIARYGSNKPTTPCRMWQWTDRQIVPGVVNPNDGDVFYGDLDDLKVWTY